MKNKTTKAILTILFTGITIGLIIAPSSPALIMIMGVRASNTLITLLSIISGGVALVNGALLTTGIVKERALTAERQMSISTEKEVTENYALDAGDAFNTRKKLIQIEQNSPGYSSLMSKCLSQMDRIDELQRRQKELIVSNSAAYLNDTENTLNQVEREICLNFRGIVNQCIVSGDDGDELNLDMDKVNSSLERNNELLTQSKELLKVSADWIDEYNNHGKSDRSLLESWIKTIRDTINKEET